MANCKARHAQCRCPNCKPLVFDAPSCTVRWRCTQCKLFEPYDPYDPDHTGFWYRLQAEPLPDAPEGVRAFDYGYVKLRGEVAAIQASRYKLTVGGGGCATRTFTLDTPTSCDCGQGCGYNAFGDSSADYDLGPGWPTPIARPFANGYGLIWDAREQATLIVSGVTDQERFFHADGTNGEFGYLQATLRCNVELSAFNHTASFPIKIGSQGVYSVPVPNSPPRIMRGCKMHYVPPMGTVDENGDYPNRYVYDIGDFKTSTRWNEGNADEIYVEADWTAQAVLFNVKVTDRPPSWTIIEPPSPLWGGAAAVMLQLRLNSFESGTTPPGFGGVVPTEPNIFPPGVINIRTQPLPYVIDPAVASPGSGLAPIQLTTLYTGEGWPGNNNSGSDNSAAAHYGWCNRQFRLVDSSIIQGNAQETPSSVWFNHFRWIVNDPFGVIGVEFPAAIVWESLWAPHN